MNKYQKLKEETEAYWENPNMYSDVSGYQFQPGTKWKPGLSKEQIQELEEEINFNLSNEIKEYLSVMNGVDREGVNLFAGNRGLNYAAIIYSFPRDIKGITDDIEKVIADSSLNRENLTDQMMVFPLMHNKYILNDESGTVISMHPGDNVQYSDSIEQYLREVCLGQKHVTSSKDVNDNAQVWFE